MDNDIKIQSMLSVTYPCLCWKCRGPLVWLLHQGSLLWFSMCWQTPQPFPQSVHLWFWSHQLQHHWNFHKGLKNDKKYFEYTEVPLNIIIKSGQDVKHTCELSFIRHTGFDVDLHDGRELDLKVKPIGGADNNEECWWAEDFYIICKGKTCVSKETFCFTQQNVNIQKHNYNMTGLSPIEKGSRVINLL